MGGEVGASNWNRLTIYATGALGSDGQSPVYGALKTLKEKLPEDVQLLVIPSKTSLKERIIGWLKLKFAVGRLGSVLRPDNWHDKALRDPGQRRPALTVYGVVPCTMNTLLKIAQGNWEAPELARIGEAIGRLQEYPKKAPPVVVAPSLNRHLMAHPRAREAIDTLKGWGVTVVEPEGSESRMNPSKVVDVMLEAVASKPAEDVSYMV